MSIDRSVINSALAKAIAHKQCGNDEQANRWALELLDLLEQANILTLRESI